MAAVTYEKDTTGLVVIDPYNDFISKGGKVWDRLKGVAEANGCIRHMLEVLEAARTADIRVFYALHHRYRPGDYETWKYVAPIQKAAWSRRTFEYGTWGGELSTEFEPQPGDVVAQEHWCSSGFANTDLDLQLMKHGIHKLIIVGLFAHTCVEATVRFAAELGYEVTMVKDATADYSDEEMHAEQTHGRERSFDGGRHVHWRINDCGPRRLLEFGRAYEFEHDDGRTIRVAV